MAAQDRTQIRRERTNDRASVREVNQAAFSRPDEADLVDALRNEGAVLVSLVAEVRGQVIGHILFTRMTIQTGRGAVPAVALAPMAVLPEHQRQGIGSRLVGQGLEELRKQGERIVLVLGHRDYYPRFGFAAEKAAKLASPFPADAFMALELEPRALDGIHGVVRYPVAFGL